MENSNEPNYPLEDRQAFSPLDFAKKHKVLVIIAAVIFLLMLLLSLLSIQSITTDTTFPTPTPIQKQNNQSDSTQTQIPYKILSTIPNDHAVNVFSGELVLTINTSDSIIAPTSLSLVFSPPLIHSFVYLNKFPTKKIQLQILGGLSPNTTYTVTVKDKKGVSVHEWSFTTSADRGEGQSKLSTQIDQELGQQYYPLRKYFPYITPNYKLGYIDRLKIKITLFNTSSDKPTILNEVKNWVKSKGVDPESHQYVFATQ